MNEGIAHGGSLHGKLLKSPQVTIRNGRDDDIGADEYIFATITMTAPGQERATVGAWLFAGSAMPMQNRLQDIIGGV